MTILVGYHPEKGGAAALELGVQLARSGTPEPLVVGTVVPKPWRTPSMAKVDGEFASWSREQGALAAEQARRTLAASAPDIEVSYRAFEGSSIPRTLLTAVDEVGADLLVVGSSSGGTLGQVVVGATSSPLMHSSHVSVAIAPRGYRLRDGGTVSRVTYAYSGSPASDSLCVTTAHWARRLGVPLRIATFGVRGSTMFPPEVGLRAEDAVHAAWREEVAQVQAAAASALVAQGLKPDETVVAVGPGWAEAVDRLPWEPGEVMVVGSSSAGPIARVFLGSRATRLIRHSPVPVLVVPNSDEAEEALVVGPG